MRHIRCTHIASEHFFTLDLGDAVDAEFGLAARRVPIDRRQYAFFEQRGKGTPTDGREIHGNAGDDAGLQKATAWKAGHLLLLKYMTARVDRAGKFLPAAFRGPNYDTGPCAYMLIFAKYRRWT